MEGGAWARNGPGGEESAVTLVVGHNQARFALPKPSQKRWSLHHICLQGAAEKEGQYDNMTPSTSDAEE